MNRLILATAALTLAACIDAGYGIPYTVACDTGEVFHGLDLIHGPNSFDPNGSHGHKYVSVTLNGKHHRDYVGRHCDWWPEL